MFKILKASSISVDSDNKFNIDVPDFNSTKNNKKPAAVNHQINFENFDEIAVTDSIIESDYDSEFVDETAVIENAENQANEIIENAKADADKIINDALNEAETLKNQIFENARSDGYNDGINAAEEETRSLKSQAQQLLQEAIQEKERIIASSENDMLDVIINVSQKILFKTLNIDNNIILNLIRQGLSQTTITGDIFIKVSDEDYENVTQNKETFCDFSDSNASIEVVKDLSLQKGDCVIETPFGNIDCGLGQQFDGIKKSLYYILSTGD